MNNTLLRIYKKYINKTKKYQIYIAYVLIHGYGAYFYKGKIILQEKMLLPGYYQNNSHFL